ncbi:hypothetical protein LSUE1_G001468 [Lachnellula suecica]|uniref:Uncharacterized protein n=1 Tax=Lachnellula suecica TaxID=602035 RepID=A0A8T9CMN8_9HELO|nr:hypothetical protein LSUE1_G001468 [Lachnellula suecica]
MSPTAFKQQVTELLSEMNRCYEFCDAIRANRRLGSTHGAFDQLQSDLQQRQRDIQTGYGTLRNTYGSRVELGDEAALSSVNKSIRDVRFIQTRLSDIAYRRSDSRDPQVPGFGDLSRKLAIVEGDVLRAFESLGQEIEHSKLKVPKPTTTPKQPQKPTLKADQVIVSLKELDTLVQHMKSCWVEKSVEGKSYYVNAFDEKKRQWDRPEGFIKLLPRVPKPTRTPTWEQRSRRPREEFWNDNTNGW